MSKLNQTEIFEKVSAIIVDRLSVEKKAVIPSANLTEDLGADSLDVVELGMQIENAFEIKLQDDEVEKLHDVQSIVQLVEQKLS